jgi:hypothetical protein
MRYGVPGFAGICFRITNESGHGIDAGQEIIELLLIQIKVSPGITCNTNYA